MIGKLQMIRKILNIVKLAIGIALVALTSLLIISETYGAFHNYNKIFFKITCIIFDIIIFMFTIVESKLIRSFFVVKRSHKKEVQLSDFRQKQREVLDNQGFIITKTFNSYSIFIIDDDHGWVAALYDH